MTAAGVTQTGQPGPDSSCTFFGSMERMPLLAMAMVWVPQTSIRLTEPALLS